MFWPFFGALGLAAIVYLLMFVFWRYCHHYTITNDGVSIRFLGHEIDCIGFKEVVGVNLSNQRLTQLEYGSFNLHTEFPVLRVRLVTNRPPIDALLGRGKQFTTVAVYPNDARAFAQELEKRRQVRRP